MKNINEFIKESQDVYVVYFGDGEMYNYSYTEEEAEADVRELNSEWSGNEAYYKKEPRTSIERK